VLIPVAVSDFSVIDLDDAAWAATAALGTRTAVIAMRAVRLMRSKTRGGGYFFRRRPVVRRQIERSPTLNASKPTGANERTVSSTGIPATCANSKGIAIMTGFQLAADHAS
jgi:hypothetical protein